MLLAMEMKTSYELVMYTHYEEKRLKFDSRKAMESAMPTRYGSYELS